MSATADFKIYEEYFSELGREDRVERINISISNLAATLQSHLLQTKVKYLENVRYLTSSIQIAQFFMFVRSKFRYTCIRICLVNAIYGSKILQHLLRILDHTLFRAV